ncbi:hypothetical protein C2E23DRAFT_835931 [Lenzites betulinus]|nr:hypothetical protein C2E23DRAFT_835931 [Lenzites betulinus]
MVPDMARRREWAPPSLRRRGEERRNPQDGSRKWRSVGAAGSSCARTHKKGSHMQGGGRGPWSDGMDADNRRGGMGPNGVEKGTRLQRVRPRERVRLLYSM